MNSKTVLLRCDMNAIIATGHVMRCLSIADAIKEGGSSVKFVSADENGRELVESRNHEYISLNSDWQKMEDELESFSKVIDETKADVVLVDTYQVTNKYLKELKKKIKTFYIDDLNDFDYPVDGIIAYAVNATDFKYSEGKELCIGTKYAPIRKEFENCLKKDIRPQIENVLVMSGGTDQFGMIEKIVDAIIPFLDKFGIKCVRAICGRLNKDYERLKGKYKDIKGVDLLSSVSDMKSQLEWADVTLTAGGSTLYEICAVGTPAITFSFADNQFGNVKGFEKMGVFKYAGDARFDNVTGNIINYLSEYTKEKRSDISLKSVKLVDGRGAKRISDVLLKG